MGGKITPTALLVIKDGATKLVNIRNQDSLSKLIDMAPDLINKFTSRDKVVTTPEEDSVMAEAAKDEERF